MQNRKEERNVGSDDDVRFTGNSQERPPFLYRLAPDSDPEEQEAFDRPAPAGVSDDRVGGAYARERYARQPENAEVARDAQWGDKPMTDRVATGTSRNASERDERGGGQERLGVNNFDRMVQSYVRRHPGFVLKRPGSEQAGIPKSSPWVPPGAAQGNRYGSSDVSQGNKSGQPGVAQDNKYGQPGVAQDNKYGPRGAEQSNMSGPPGVAQGYKYVPPGVAQGYKYGPPGAEQGNKYGPLGVAQVNKYGPRGAEQSNMSGPPAEAQSSGYGPPKGRAAAPARARLSDLEHSFDESNHASIAAQAAEKRAEAVAYRGRPVSMRPLQETAGQGSSGYPRGRLASSDDAWQEESEFSRQAKRTVAAVSTAGGREGAAMGGARQGGVTEGRAESGELDSSQRVLLTWYNVCNQQKQDFYVGYTNNADMVFKTADVPIGITKESCKFVRFLAGHEAGFKDVCGRDLPEEWQTFLGFVSMTDAQLEGHFISWALTTDQPSGQANGCKEVITPVIRRQILETVGLTERCHLVLTRMLFHVGIAAPDQTSQVTVGNEKLFATRLGSGNHNVKRMSRALRFCSLFFPSKAMNLLQLLISQVNHELLNPDGLLIVSSETFEHWKASVYGPLGLL